MNKRDIMVIVCGLSIILLMYMGLSEYSRPIEVSRSLDGVRFISGEDKNYQGSIVLFEGKIQKRIFASEEFSGLLMVDSIKIENVVIKISEQGYPLMDAYGERYGEIYTDETLTSVVIIEDSTDQNLNNASSLIVISAPCKDREDAVKLTKDILSKVYKNIDIN